MEHEFIKDDFIEEFECGICYYDIAIRDKISLLACDKKHLFHDECLEHWIKYNQTHSATATCPMCRVRIDKGKVQHKIFHGFSKQAYKVHELEQQKFKKMREEEKEERND